MAMILPHRSPACAAALLAALSLARCVDSAAPLLNGAQPTFGPHVRIHGYSLVEGHARRVPHVPSPAHPIGTMIDCSHRQTSGKFTFR